MALTELDSEYQPTLALTRRLLRRQLSSLFVFDQSKEGAALDKAAADALRRSLKCFDHNIGNKYYHRAGRVVFNPFHTCQYGIFLYYLSNTILALGPQQRSLADRVYYLNRALNSVDLYHEVELPEIFSMDHPLGSVIGRARYSNFFSFSQSCTVGNNKGVYPRFGEDVRMLSGAKVLGDCDIGSHVILSANCYVKDTNVPSCSIVFGSSPNLDIKHKSLDYFLELLKGRYLVPGHVAAESSPPLC